VSGGEWAVVAWRHRKSGPEVRSDLSHSRALEEMKWWVRNAKTVAVVRMGQLGHILRED